MANQSALPEPGCEYPLFIPAPIFAAAVDEVEVNIKAPRSLVISGALTAISLVSQGLIDVLKPNNQVVPVSLMLATIADSGDRKSTAQDALLKSVRSFEVGRDDEYKRESYCQIWCMTIRQRSCPIDYPPVFHLETEHCPRPASVDRIPLFASSVSERIGAV